MNVDHESFKLHLTPVNPKETWETGPHRTSGGVILHNTVVKRNPPFRVWSDEGPACNFLMRNNLLVGAAAGAIDISCPMRDCDLDCDAYVAGGEAFKLFAYWNRTRYATLADFAEKTGMEKHGLALPSPAGLFAAAVKIPADKEKCEPLDARLAPASAAVDKGEVLPGINDGFAGKAPDIGAVEQGSELPQYGPRPEVR
jgi:hypothetical protein